MGELTGLEGAVAILLLLWVSYHGLAIIGWAIKTIYHWSKL